MFRPYPRISVLDDAADIGGALIVMLVLCPVFIAELLRRRRESKAHIIRVVGSLGQLSGSERKALQ